MPPEINIEWDFILDSIESDRTIFCIGSEIYSHTIGDLDSHLQKAIGESKDIQFYRDGLFHFKGTSDLFSHIKIKKFYKQDFPELRALLEKIAHIRVSTIISLNPDAKLVEIFKNQGYKYDYDFHYPNHPAKDLKIPNHDNPLIYNLFGTLDQKESMIYTHGNMFDYLKSSFIGQSIPTALKVKIDSADNFIFIGLPFEKWYTQLLMRILHKDEKNGMKMDVAKYAFNHTQNEKNIIFCQNEFNVTCIQDNIGDFVDELYEKCKSANLLRLTESEKTNNKIIYSILLEKDKLEDLINLLKKDAKISFSQSTILTHLSSDMVALENKKNMGSISDEDYSVARTKIRERIISFINNL